MRVYCEMGYYSDLSVIDTGYFGDAGIEINNRDGRTWSCLTLDEAIEQLGVLWEQGVRGAPTAIASLESERLIASQARLALAWLNIEELRQPCAALLN